MDLNLLDEVKKRPGDFRILERVPFTCETMTFPLDIDCAAGDEISIVCLDIESTGLVVDTCGVTQLGLTKLKFSPSLGRITRIETSKSWLNDPGHPIPPMISELTGLTDDIVKGKVIKAEDIASFFEDDPLVCAHNASFDRSFAEKHLPIPADLRWGCSASEINWVAAGLESRKLEFICYRLGGFYEGHRADVDTLAMAWVFFSRPDLLCELISNTEQHTVIVRAIRSPFEKKDVLKEYGFKWDDGSKGHEKHWFITSKAEKLDEIMDFLNTVYPSGNKATVEFLNARRRFK
ncbi:3'-5' exonuclease [Rheinheimera sp.]|uniref:3'-5' exonuclease n=1 Tax=Rheinheimera sp. TaxID=1869214 RepID=UPI004047CC19